MSYSTTPLSCACNVLSLTGFSSQISLKRKSSLSAPKNQPEPLQLIGKPAKAAVELANAGMSEDAINYWLDFTNLDVRNQSISIACFKDPQQPEFTLGEAS